LAGPERINYLSGAVTTALCLQSLCAARQVLEQEVRLEVHADADISRPAVA
jgi:hypothetical protein